MGVAVVDILAGTHVAQGILACLYQRTISGEGAFVQVSMFESILDFQFEVLTCYYNDGKQLPIRSAVNGANAYIAAPYGIYATSDGHIALAMVDIIKLGQLLHCAPLEAFKDASKWFDQRDEIKSIIASHLTSNTCDFWLSLLEPADVWCAKVLDYKALMEEEAYQALNMEIVVKTSTSIEITTTRCPIKVDGQYFVSAIGAPLLGEHNAQVDQQFGLKNQQQTNPIL
jgi:crotonobetainyl-CoA:carnitine CoA-transferase CaiB-like acyl-CoA transferase